MTGESSSSVTRTQKGMALYRRALELIPGGTQTNAKRPPAELCGVYPPYIVRGEGGYVWDLDGNRYVDHKLGCGPVILGHDYPAVVEAVMRQLRDGLVFGSAHPLEVELAELLIQLIPCAEMVRFLKSGAEGTSAAVRLARAHTGRDTVISCGYNGWQDWSMAKNSAVAGIPAAVRALTLDLGFGDEEGLKEVFCERGNEIAALVVAAPYDRGLEEIGGFLRQARELTQRCGAVLVYDEIVTGFRVALGGIQEATGIVPDLAVFSKGMANGFPIAAVAGRRKFMVAWERTVISSTFGGEACSLAAALATVRELKERCVPQVLARRGAWLKEEALRLGEELGVPMRAAGFDSLPHIAPAVGKEAAMAFQRALLENGVFPYYPLWYLCYAHDEAALQESARGLRAALAAVREVGG